VHKYNPLEEHLNFEIGLVVAAARICVQPKAVNMTFKKFEYSPKQRGLERLTQ